MRDLMQNLTRNSILLVASLLVLAPAASAQGLGANGLVDLSATADVQAKADASGALRAVDDAKAQAEAAAAEVQSKANGIRADAQARGEAALEQTQAHAEAGAEASMSFGARAMAGIQGAFEQVKEFAAGLFGAAHVKAEVDASSTLQGAIDG